MGTSEPGCMSASLTCLLDVQVTQAIGLRTLPCGSDAQLGAGFPGFGHPLL